MEKEMPTMSVEQKRIEIRTKRSEAEKIARTYTGPIAPGMGKGKEPRPWCLCHNRNPCPIDLELKKYTE